MGGMMGGFGGGFGIIGLLFNLIILIGVVLLIIWVGKQVSGGGQGANFFGGQTSRAEETPREILQRRYARGEISREEYQQMLSDLS